MGIATYIVCDVTYIVGLGLHSGDLGRCLSTHVVGFHLPEVLNDRPGMAEARQGSSHGHGETNLGYQYCVYSWRLIRVVKLLNKPTLMSLRCKNLKNPIGNFDQSAIKKTLGMPLAVAAELPSDSRTRPALRHTTYSRTELKS